MSTSILNRYTVTTVGPRGAGRRTVTVAARDKAAAAAAAITAHRANAGLPANASVLTSGITLLLPAHAPKPMSELEIRRLARLHREAMHRGDSPPDAA